MPTTPFGVVAVVVVWFVGGCQHVSPGPRGLSAGGSRCALGPSPRWSPARPWALHQTRARDLWRPAWRPTQCPWPSACRCASSRKRRTLGGGGREGGRGVPKPGGPGRRQDACAPRARRRGKAGAPPGRRRGLKEGTRAAAAPARGRTRASAVAYHPPPVGTPMRRARGDRWRRTVAGLAHRAPRPTARPRTPAPATPAEPARVGNLASYARPTPASPRGVSEVPAKEPPAAPDTLRPGEPHGALHHDPQTCGVGKDAGTHPTLTAHIRDLVSTAPTLAAPHTDPATGLHRRT